jgi:polyphosphate glucokinase
LELLLSPDLFVLGGGICKKLDKFEPYLKVNAKIVAAKLQNNAGIVGAAAYAKKRMDNK